MKVIRLTERNQAIVTLGDIKKEVSLALVDGVVPGEYVIVHAGYVLQKVDTVAADHTLALMASMVVSTRPSPGQAALAF